MRKSIRTRVTVVAVLVALASTAASHLIQSFSLYEKFLKFEQNLAAGARALLHNVGNVLTGVNVSAGTLANTVRRSRAELLEQIELRLLKPVRPCDGSTV